MDRPANDEGSEQDRQEGKRMHSRGEVHFCNPAVTQAKSADGRSRRAIPSGGSGTREQAYSVPALSGSTIYAAASGDTLEGAMQAWEQLLAKYDRTTERTLRVKQDGIDNTLERADRTWGNQDGLFDEDEWRHFVRNNGPRSLAAVRLGGTGDVSDTHALWRTEPGVPTVPSPVLYDGILYYVRDGGILTALDPENGRVIKEARLEGAIDKYFASPVAADGKLYLASESGQVVIVRAGRAWEVPSVHSFDESV